MDQLRLFAVDADDLQILSAHCQDAVVRTADCRLLGPDRRFVLPMNRFVWEKAGAERGLLGRLRKMDYERRRAVLHFDRVAAVRQTGVRIGDPGEILALLAIRFLSGGEPPAGTIELVFAGASAIRLDVECIEAQLTDLGAAWSTGARPDHEHPEPETGA